MPRCGKNWSRPSSLLGGRQASTIAALRQALKDRDPKVPHQGRKRTRRNEHRQERKTLPFYSRPLGTRDFADRHWAAWYLARLEARSGAGA